MPSTASTMPSLPEPSSVPASAMHASHTSTPYNYREVSYHLDNRGRYAIESYEVRPPSLRSPPASSPYTQRLQPTGYHLVLRSTERSNPTDPRTTPQNPIIVVQSCEGLQLDKAGSKGMAADSPKSAAPPPAPRPRRLSTPELSDLDEERLFCYCDAKKNCDSKKRCVRKACRRALS